MAQSKRFHDEPQGGFIKSKGSQKPRSLKAEECLGKRFRQDRRPRQPQE